jgi:hypothetical protein
MKTVICSESGNFVECPMNCGEEACVGQTVVESGEDFAATWPPRYAGGKPNGNAPKRDGENCIAKEEKRKAK